MTDFHVGDIGTPIEFEAREDGAAIDISTATSMDITIKRPDGTILSVSGAFVTDGTDGKLDYTTVSGDLSVSGEYCAQVKLTLPAGTWNSDVDHFDVAGNLS